MALAAVSWSFLKLVDLPQLAAWMPSLSRCWPQTVHLVFSSHLWSSVEMGSWIRSLTMARKIGSGMVPLWEVPRSERVEVPWQLSKILRCWVRSKEAKMVLRLSSWAMRERRFWSWRLELPVWTLNRSWSIFGDCRRLVRARAVRWSEGLPSVFWLELLQKEMSALWGPHDRPRPAIGVGSFLCSLNHNKNMFWCRYRLAQW